MNHTGQNPPNHPKTRVASIIPARYESTRLPGKALLDIAGKPMICHVAEQARLAKNVDRVIVATDDQRIFDSVVSCGYEAFMTNGNHASGTDRIAEVAATLPDFDIIVNVQGDEPLIAPLTIERAVAELATHEHAGMVTTWEPIETAADVFNPDVVKIVVDSSRRALYFSRSPVPFPRDAVRAHGSLTNALRNDSSLLGTFRKHTGLYVYRREVLLQFTGWRQSDLEQLESLEQLRALENGVEIRAIEASSQSIGVDTAEDLERVRRAVEKVSSFV